ncbi:MAG: hypothetical protein KC635_18110, partial [Myxococcales bacterium]|nr:hypothetical protein [Myxococcales bacterium]
MSTREQAAPAAVIATLAACALLGGLLATPRAAHAAPGDVVWGSDTVTSTSVAGCGGPSGFGSGLAVDGDTLAVGADGSCVDGAASEGAVVVFDRLGSAWSESSVVTRPNGAAQEGFGHRVAIAAGILAVSAPGADGGDGAIDVFVRLGRRFRAVASLALPDGAPRGTAAAELGASLATADGVTILAGAPGLTPGGAEGAGAVAVVTRDSGGDFAVTQILAAPTPTAGAHFGAAVAFDGRHLAATSAGAVEIFEQRAPGDPLVHLQTLPVAGAVGVAFGGGRLAVTTTGGGTGAIRVYALADGQFATPPTTITPSIALTGPVGLSGVGVAAATTGG